MAVKIEKVRVNMYLPKSLIERIDAEAEQMGTSRSGVIAQRMNQFYLDMETQTQMNEGIKMLTGMSSDELTEHLLKGMLKDMTKGKK